MDGSIDRWMVSLMDGWSVGWKDGWIDRWMVGWLVGWMDELMAGIG
jgi:beta-lactamase class D